MRNDTKNRHGSVTISAYRLRSGQGQCGLKYFKCGKTIWLFCAG